MKASWTGNLAREYTDALPKGSRDGGLPHPCEDLSKIRHLLNVSHVSPIRLQDEEERLLYKRTCQSSGLENCYANSWAYIWQIANKYSLKFFDGFHLFSLTPGWGRMFPDELTINSAQTVTAAEAALEFATRAAALLGRTIRIRKVYGQEAVNYFRDIGVPARPPEPLVSEDVRNLPDDNYPERVVDIADQLAHQDKRFEYLRLRVNRFGKQTAGKVLELREEYSREDYFRLLKSWSHDVTSRLAKRYPAIDPDSIREWVEAPYPALYEFFHRYRSETDLFSFIHYMNGRPAGLMCACRVSATGAALYANFSVTEAKGFPFVHSLAISQYLRTKGFTHVNLGGSEIQGLDLFKYRCGGFMEIRPSTFLVHP